MKTNLRSPRRLQAGYALLMVLLFGTISILVLATAMRRTMNTANLNERNNAYTVNLSAAEAATEKVIARMMADYELGADTLVSNNLSAYRSMVPSASESPYWTNFEFSDGQGNIGKTYVKAISSRVYKPLQSQYYGLSGWSTTYRVLSNARQTTGYNTEVLNAVQQDVELDSIPVFQFAIFYNSLLEFTWAAPMTVRGRTHANSSIFLGSSAPLTFNETATATGVIMKKAWDGFRLSDFTGSITFLGNPDYRTNVATLSLPIGTNNTAQAVREIINVPPPGESVTSPMGEERFYNKAGMVLLVSNATVTAMIKSSASDSAPVVLQASNSPTAVSALFPFLSTTNVFKDQRENDWMKTTQIDMGRLTTWSTTNSAILDKHPVNNPFNILYVGDFRSTSSTTNTAVRLANGKVIPKGLTPSGAPSGFSVATPNPLYVWGHYNNMNDAYLGTTNTSATVPASLVSDALTVLSPNWQDSLSSGSFLYRHAADTTVNAAIITGMVYSQGSDGSSPFSGGVMNLPRLLEDWGNGARTLTLNTSIVNFYNSVKATGPFQNPGNYYYAPSRNFNFDPNFKDATKQPPGTPHLNVLIRGKWANPPANDTTYAGS